MPIDELDTAPAPRTWDDELAGRERQAENNLAANWQTFYERLDAPRRGWADLLMRQSWHWFTTLTFKPKHEGPCGGVHPEKGDKAFRLLISCINRELYGPRWAKHGKSLVWARGTELHKSGRIHFHALVACVETDLNQVPGARRLDWMDWWFREFGIARIEPPESQEDICGYVSKYVVKGGEVDMSPNFGRVRPPSLFGSPAQESGADQRPKPTGLGAAEAPRDREPAGRNGAAEGRT